jgi:hypothetical protein
LYGDEDFDEHCKYGNRIVLTADQVTSLRGLVAEHQPTIPYYVCKMTKSYVIPGKAKMLRLCFVIFLVGEFYFLVAHPRRGVCPLPSLVPKRAKATPSCYATLSCQTRAAHYSFDSSNLFKHN